MIKELKDIFGDDFIIVGSYALKLHGFDVSPKDIDIITSKVPDQAEVFSTESPLSQSGQRGFMYRDPYNIDIFVEAYTDYEIIKGAKVQTIESMLDYYRNIILSNDDTFFVNYSRYKINKILLNACNSF